jgi:hypothetical protein
MTLIRHGDYNIKHNPKPVPSREHDYDYSHDDYQGPGDDRHGTSGSEQGARDEIDEIGEHEITEIDDERMETWKSHIKQPPMESKMRLPSTAAMEILAVSDQPVFESLMKHIGLPITGRVEENPLKQSMVQNETIAAVASEITEDIHTYVDVDPRLHSYKEIAEDYGYVVAFS